MQVITRYETPMNRRACTFLIPILYFAGCATAPYVPPASTAHYEQVLSLYKGKNVAEVPAAWPAPYTVPMAEGNKMITWANTPQWGCSTIGLTDSSGTILSWQWKGDHCMMAYTDAEIQNLQARFDALRTRVPGLKRGTHIRLTFYDGAVDSRSHAVRGDVDCYFIAYSKVYGEISVRNTPERKHTFNLSKDIITYELRYVSDLQILKDEGPAVSP